MKIPESIKPIWRTVQLVRITKGLDDGLRLFIVGPFLYEIFKQVSGPDTAMFFASLAWAVYHGLIAFLEIPTGVLADAFGRVYAITIAFVCNMLFALGLASLVLFKNISVVFAVVMVISIVRATAMTFYNGSFYAWMVDSIREREPNFGYEHLMARGYTYYSCAMVVGAVLGITFYLYDIAYVAFILAAFFCLNGATYCATCIQETRAVQFSKLQNFWGDAANRMSTTLVTAFRVCHQVPILWWLLLLFGCYSFFGNAISYLWPIVLGLRYGSTKWSFGWYLMAFGIPAITGLYSQLLAWAGARHQRLTGQKLPTSSLMKWVYFSCWLGTGAVIVTGVLQEWVHISFWLFAFAVVSCQSIDGVVDSCLSALINEYIPHKNTQERATIMSVGNMLMGVLVLIFLVPTSSPNQSASVTGWLLPAGIMVVVLIASKIYITKWSNLKSQNNIDMVTEPESLKGGAV